jgi:hypothetical protein
MNKETRLELKLTLELFEQFKKLADKKQISVSALIRLLMLEYIENEENS